MILDGMPQYEVLIVMNDSDGEEKNVTGKVRAGAVTIESYAESLGQPDLAAVVMVAAASATALSPKVKAFLTNVFYSMATTAPDDLDLLKLEKVERQSSDLDELPF